jgi:hypothetical protein
MIFGRRDDEDIVLFLIRWAARILSIAIIFLLMLFALGEDGVTSGAGVRGSEFIGLLFFPVGIAAGFIIGWKNELLGGVISGASLVCFYLVYGLAMTGRVPRGAWFAAFTVPGFLFLAYGLVRLFRNNSPRRDSVDVR